MNGTQTRAAYFFEQKRVDRLPFLSGWPRVWTKANESAVLETKLQHLEVEADGRTRQKDDGEGLAAYQPASAL